MNINEINSNISTDQKIEITGNLQENKSIFIEQADEILFSIDVKENVTLIINILSANNLKGTINLKANCIVNLICTSFNDGDNNYSLFVNLKGENSSFNSNFAVIASNNNKKEVKINVEHLAKFTSSNVISMGVSLDKSTLKILGDTKINRGMKKSSANTVGKVIIFNDGVNCSVSPQLLIDENDVFASHGASLGRVNEDQLFYLMSRGIKEDLAKDLIIQGLLLPVIETFENEQFRKEAQKIALKKVTKNV